MTVVLYSSAGTFTWICPASVTSISIECVGGGGGGGTRTTNGGGGGGGGGAYAKVNAFTVTPGQSYTVVVGAAGTPGGAAGDSTFNSTTCVAKAGTSTASNTATGSAGGLASGCTGDIKRDGGSGWTASGSGGGGGSSAGIDAAGVTATSATGAAAVVAGGIGGNGATASNTNGNAPASGWGGGGGGGYRTSSGTRTGGNGAAGMVRITYAPYSMTDFWGCGLWLDANDASTITLVSGAVSQWNDKSGNARNFSQSTAGYRPALTTAGQNRRDVLTFDGSDDHLTRADFTLNSYTLFAVVKHAVTSDVVVVGSATVNMQNRENRSSTGNYSFYDESNGAFTEYISTSTDTNFTTAHLFGVLKTGTTSVEFFRDGTSFGSVAGGGNLTSTVRFSQISSLKNATTPSLMMNGWIAEIVVFERALSTSERQTVESTLTTKWLTATSDTIQPHNRRGGFRGIIVR